MNVIKLFRVPLLKYYDVIYLMFIKLIIKFIVRGNVVCRKKNWKKFHFFHQTFTIGNSYKPTESHDKWLSAPFMST